MNEQCPGEEDKPRDECGVVGIRAPGHERLGEIAYAAIAALQHRGQEAAGILVSNADGVRGMKGLGLVDRVVPDRGLSLNSWLPEPVIALAQTRYSTSTPGSNLDAVPPFSQQGSDSQRWQMAHNGTVNNAYEVAANRYDVDRDDCQSDSDALFRSLVVAAERTGGLLLAIDEVLPQVEGAYSLVLSDGQNLYGARDPNGYRPLKLGRLNDDGYILASEDPALRRAGAVYERDIEPGEIITIGPEGIQSSRINKEPSPGGGLCYFEYVYLARPEGAIHGESVSAVRKRSGAELAREYPVENRENAVVVGVPESGRGAALGFAEETGVAHGDGLIKNPYAPRAFITGEAGREAVLDEKFSVDPEVVGDKEVYIVDDSIVRGDTLRHIVKQIREAGATKVHIRIPSMPHRWPCHYGIDTGNPEQLLAHRFPDPEDMRQHLGVDSLGFLSESGTRRAIGDSVGALCMECAIGPKSADSSEPIQLGMPKVRDP